MKRFIEGLLRGNSGSQAEESPVKQDPLELRENYQRTIRVAGLYRSKFGEPSPFLETELRGLERGIIEGESDSLKRAVISVCIADGRDLRPIFEGEEKGNWAIPIQEMCDGLAGAMGKRYNKEGVGPYVERTPYKGEEMLAWMISLAKQDGVQDREEKPIDRVHERMQVAVEGGMLCGKTAEELGINNQDIENIFREITQIIFFTRDYRPQLELLLAIVKEVPRGEEWIRSLIAEKGRS